MKTGSESRRLIDELSIHFNTVYHLPSLCGDERNEHRRLHRDLAGMDLTELENEALRVQSALAFGDLNEHQSAYVWLTARLQKVKEEIADRMGG